MKTIIRLAARGDGVDDAGDFHAGGVPGDTIAEDGTLIPGPHRKEPPCPHFGRCGGCQLQHIDDETYARFVEDRIGAALAAQGLETKIRSAHLSPSGSRRRASMRATRIGKRVVLGYAEASTHKLVDLNACTILHPKLFALLSPLRQMLGVVLPERKTANIRMTLADQGVDLLISGIEVEGLQAIEAVTSFGERMKLGRISVDEGFGPSPRWEPEPVTITLSGLPVPFPEGAFLQATQDAEAILSAAALEAIAATSKRADLFSGLGTFTFASGAIYAAEGGRDAILALQSAARAAGRNLAAEHRDLFRRPLTPQELDRFDGIVLDPPRAGAKEQVNELAKSKVSAIAYVSCNPSTFARDARTLVDGGYALDWVQPVGQFRWSTHVELAARFSR